MKLRMQIDTKQQQILQFLNLSEKKMLDDSTQKEQQFQKVEDDVEYLRFAQEEIISSPTVGFSKSLGTKMSYNESVTLKFQRVPNSALNSLKASKQYAINKHKSNSYKVPYLDNINQLPQQQPTQQQNLSYSEIHQNGVSPLGSHYENHPHAKLMYKKQKQIGTKWIGQKEYWSSVFASWEMIQKAKDKKFYSNQNDSGDNKGIFSRSDNKPVNLLGQVQFDSDFQSGNLYAAYKVGIFQYDLILQNDTNTKGNTQWFYFCMSNLPVNKNIRINIVNLRKSQSLFGWGMLPCFYSSEQQKRTGQKWIRKGTQVKYYRNSHLVQGQNRKYYYTLSFIISTQYQNDIVRIAQSYPYTYNDLTSWLQSLTKVNYRRNYLKKNTIINKTLGGNKIQILTIKQSNNQRQKTLSKPSSILQQQITKQSRPLIILLARQHPGQTPGSFMMQGIVQFLLSKQKDAQYLRKNFQILAIPMLNPDGVQAGNYRTNLLGIDMNRKWDCVTKQTNINNTNSKPKQCRQQAYEIVYIKRYLNAITKNRQIAYIIDLHGHSRKLNSFFYGNTYPQSPLQTKMFPYICSRLSSMIKFQDCTFGIEEDKRSTARIQLFNMLKSPNIYTFQASFFGFVKKGQKRHFTVQNYKMLGQVIGKAMYICQKSKECDIDGKQRVLWEKWGKEVRVMAEGGNNTNDKQHDGNGSDSAPQQFQIQEAQRQLLTQQFTQISKNPLNLQSIKPTTATRRQRATNRQQTFSSSKQPIKSLRQMQVLDIAKINSVFPYDVLALVPNSFCLKVDGQNNVKDNKMRQSQKSIKKVDVKNFGVQTIQCRLIKVYELCKGGENNFLGAGNNEQKIQNESTLHQQKLFIKNTQRPVINQNKSQLISRPKSKTTNTFSTNTSSFIQQTIKNLSTLTITRSKSIHQKQLFQNARHLNAIKKSTDIRKNFKKVFTEFQLGKVKGEGIRKVQIDFKNKHKTQKSVQTLITFCQRGIAKSPQPQIQQKTSIMAQSTESLQYTPKKSVLLQEQESSLLVKPPQSLLTTPTTTPKPFFQQSLPLKHQHNTRSKIHQTSQKYWTIDAKNPKHNLQIGLSNNNNKSYNPARSQFRKTTIISKNVFRNETGYNSCQRGGYQQQKMLENWRIKKKSLI